MTQYTQRQTEALEFCKKYFIVAVKIRDFVGHFCNSRLLQELLIVKQPSKYQYVSSNVIGNNLKNIH